MSLKPLLQPDAWAAKPWGDPEKQRADLQGPIRGCQRPAPPPPAPQPIGGAGAVTDSPAARSRSAQHSSGGEASVEQVPRRLAKHRKSPVRGGHRPRPSRAWLDGSGRLVPRLPSPPTRASIMAAHLPVSLTPCSGKPNTTRRDAPRGSQAWKLRGPLGVQTAS